ncbi:NnrU family protein [Agrobacterium vitis]|uniref:NnrU family protein n=1 Tax=Rhizobium/Agrobacterium group TaxID=227290 RepID=UPI0009C0A1D9|nr:MULTISPECIES: NnrU family protein [Rhizobium/Agrobacterium group]MCF1464167.1 NnrU family protein [Allorhizobium ampelinum]MCF1484840.1 NnrU family protein [Allorhizobium ampelinum]MUO71968.1 NnrU family protein [Agrobacterium vitis]
MISSHTPSTQRWMFQAALAMDYVALWESAAWQAWITLITAPIGMFLVLAGLFSANPLSVTMRSGEHVPGAITAVTRHPVLWGFWLWAAGHMVPNGDLRSFVLFGSFALFAAAGIVIVERRSRRRLGDTWGQLSSGTAILPFAAIVSGRARFSLDRVTVAAALSTELATLWLLTGGHLALFAADPLLLTLPQ